MGGEGARGREERCQVCGHYCWILLIYAANASYAERIDVVVLSEIFNLSRLPRVLRVVRLGCEQVVCFCSLSFGEIGRSRYYVRIGWRLKDRLHLAPRTRSKPGTRSASSEGVEWWTVLFGAVSDPNRNLSLRPPYFLVPFLP